jgi:hypothetical protein
MSEENMEEWGVTGNCYLIEGSLRKLSMYHKYARILVIFDLVVENKKIVLKRVENGE